MKKLCLPISWRRFANTELNDWAIRVSIFYIQHRKFLQYQIKYLFFAIFLNILAHYENWRLLMNAVLQILETFLAFKCKVCKSCTIYLDYKDYSKIVRNRLTDFGFGTQSFTSFMADSRQGINSVSSFSRCLNGTFPWRYCSVQTLLH